MGKRKTTKEFIEQAVSKFGERFDYSKVVYINISTKVLISCSVHKEFELTPEQHLRSQQGCPHCPLDNLGRKAKSLTQFIVDANKKHNNKFDYSKVIYKNNKADITIICKEHGPFLQSPCEHLKGVYGCRSCASKGTKLTQKEYLERARAVHGDRYDYSKTTYSLNKNPITVICRKHGAFTLSSAGNHLRGNGCSDCTKVTGVSTYSWIKRAKETHGNKYDYSETEYLGANKNLRIICSKHGPFQQIASHHERGSNCPKCANRYSYSDAEYIEKCIAIHGERYNYRDTVFKGAKSKVTYICSHHGKVQQQAYDHMAGRGCVHCSGRAKYTSKEWIKLCNEVHQNKYDYSKVSYQGKDKKVVITCPDHGDFYQVAGTHIRGTKCPSCANKGFDSNKCAHLYILQSYDTPLNMIKVGISNRLLPRLIDVGTVTPFKFIRLKSFFFESGADALDIETRLKQFAKKSNLTITFDVKFSGFTEWFKYSHDFIHQSKMLIASKTNNEYMIEQNETKGLELFEEDSIGPILYKTLGIKKRYHKRMSVS